MFWVNPGLDLVLLKVIKVRVLVVKIKRASFLLFIGNGFEKKKFKKKTEITNAGNFFSRKLN